MLTIEQIKSIEFQVSEISPTLNNDCQVTWNMFFKKLFYLNYLMAYLRDYFHDRSTTKEELESVEKYYNKEFSVSVEEIVKYLKAVYPQLAAIENMDEFINEAKRSEVGEENNKKFMDRMIVTDKSWA